MEYILIIISAVFVNNIVLNQFLGVCPFLGVSNRISTAGRYECSRFVCNDTVNAHYVFDPDVCVEPVANRFHADRYLYFGHCRTRTNGRDCLKKISPALYQALGIFLPLITTNCAVLGSSYIGSDSRIFFWRNTGLAYLAASARLYGRYGCRFWVGTDSVCRHERTYGIGRCSATV